MTGKVTCGSCRLHASHFYGNSKNGFVVEERSNDCCADIEIDLPASWNNQTPMDPASERWCPIWRPVVVSHVLAAVR